MDVPSDIKDACPFCGSGSTDISMKVSSTGRVRKYHYSVYCKECHTYGPRVLFKMDDKPYVSRESLENNPEVIKKAINLWNNRSKL